MCAQKWPEARFISFLHVAEARETLNTKYTTDVVSMLAHLRSGIISDCHTLRSDCHFETYVGISPYHTQMNTQHCQTELTQQYCQIQKVLFFN